MFRGVLLPQAPADATAEAILSLLIRLFQKSFDVGGHARAFQTFKGFTGTFWPAHTLTKALHAESLWTESYLFKSR